MAYKGSNMAKHELLLNLGRDLRKIRVDSGSGYSCEFVASRLNPEAPSRDRISKLERGESGIDLYDYLRLMWFYRDLVPTHPGVVLARQLLPYAALQGGGHPDAKTVASRLR